MSQKSWESDVSTIVEDMQEGLRSIAGPGGSVKVRIGRAARLVGFDYWRTFDLWYGKARRIDGHEISAVKAKQRKEEALRVETDALLAELRERVEILEKLVADQGQAVPARPQHTPAAEGDLVGGVLGRPSR